MLATGGFYTLRPTIIFKTKIFKKLAQRTLSLPLPFTSGLRGLNQICKLIDNFSFFRLLMKEEMHLFHFLRTTAPCEHSKKFVSLDAPFASTWNPNHFRGTLAKFHVWCGELGMPSPVIKSHRANQWWFITLISPLTTLLPFVYFVKYILLFSLRE